MGDGNKRGKVTAENRREAAALKAIWEREKPRLKTLGYGTQDAFGDKFDIGNQAAVGFFLNGDTALSHKAASGFARGLECRIADFSTRLSKQGEPAVLPHGPRTVEVVSGAALAGALPAPGYVRLPVLAEAAAGAGRVVGLEIVQNVDVLEEWLRLTLRTNPSVVRVMTARGHSMAGVIEDGDVMFIEPCTSFDSDGLYVLSVDDLLRVKRLRLRVLDKQLSIESTDGSSPELTSVDDVGTRVLIHGRVIACWNLRRL